MACSCKARRQQGVPAIAPAPETRLQPQAFPHEVLPGESCIFCADKHLSTAYTQALSAWNIPVIVGELELARRHTHEEYPEECSKIAELEIAVLMRDRAGFASKVSDVLARVAGTVSYASSQADTPVDGQMFVLEQPKMDSTNPFIGELHLYAAYRLASEVGYMMPNRQMIIGDLDLAREHLVRYDYGVNTQLRELRHRVQTTRAADLNIYWPYVCSVVAKIVEEKLGDYKDEYEDGLKDYLGIAR